MASPPGEPGEQPKRVPGCVWVCVFFFALMIAWWTIADCVDVFLVRARKKKVCVWRNCSVH